MLVTVLLFVVLVTILNVDSDSLSNPILYHELATATPMKLHNSAVEKFLRFQSHRYNGMYVHFKT